MSRPFLRFDAHRHELRHIGIAKRGAGRDQAADQLVFIGALLDANAAAVRHAARRLGEKQARFRGRVHDAPAACFLDESVVVGLRIEAEDGELEAVLPAGVAVTACRVTAIARQERLDVVFEMVGTLVLRALNVHVDDGEFARGLDGDLGFAVGDAASDS